MAINQVFYRTHTVQASLDGAEFESTTKVEAIVVMWYNQMGRWVNAQLSAVFTKPDGSVQEFKQEYPKIIHTGAVEHMVVDIVPFVLPGDWTCDVIIADPDSKEVFDTTKIPFKVLKLYEKPTIKDEYDITPNIRGYQFLVDTEYMFDVRFTYTGGHGSGGDLHAYVPRIYQKPDETENAYKSRLWSETRSAVADVVKDNEALQAAKKHSLKYMDYMNATYRGAKGQIHIN